MGNMKFKGFCVSLHIRGNIPLNTIIYTYR